MEKIVSITTKCMHDQFIPDLGIIYNTKIFSNWVRTKFKLDHDMYVSEKIKGLTIEAIYEKGVLLKVITKGDGVEGFDITDNAMLMNGVQPTLKYQFSGSLFGTVTLRKSNCKFYDVDYNVDNVIETVFITAHRADGEKCEFLDVYFYDMVGNIQLLTEIDQYFYMKKILGLQVPQAVILSFSGEVVDLWQQYQAYLKDSLDYMVSGLIVKVANKSRQTISAEQKPQQAIAFLFSPEKRDTEIVDFLWSVEGDGEVCLSLKIKPITINGSLVTRAKVTSIDQLIKLKLGKGSQITVKHCDDDLVPYVDQVLSLSNSVEQLPKFCMQCASHLQQINGKLMCPSTMVCPAQKAKRIKNWVSAIGLNIDNSIIQALIDDNRVITVNGLYALKEKDLERINNRTAAKQIIKAIKEKRILTLKQFITGLSMPHINSTVAELVAKEMVSITELVSASYKEIAEIPGISGIEASSLFFSLRTNYELIMTLLGRCMINIKPEKQN